MRVLLALLVGALGAAAFVHGGSDDSPGLQLVGAVLVTLALALAVRAQRARGSRTR